MTDKMMAQKKELCPLCNKFGDNIHYLAVKKVVKEDVISQVREERYLTCSNSNCCVVFYNIYGDRIFLVEDINMGANFDEITKSKGVECSLTTNCHNCHK